MEVKKLSSKVVKWVFKKIDRRGWTELGKSCKFTVLQVYWNTGWETMETETVGLNFDGRGWHHLIVVLPLPLGDNQIPRVSQCAATDNTEHHLEHSPDEKLNQKVIKPLDQLQLIVNIRDRFTFQLKTQSTKTRMLTILQGGKMMHFLCWLNGMTHSHKKECIWLSSNEVDGPRALIQSEVSQKENKSYILTHVYGI